MIRLFFSVLFTAVLAQSAAAETPYALDVFGVWLTEEQTSKVEITDCGGGAPCGAIIWIDDPAPDALRDSENPDAALRDRPLIGLTILSGFEAKKAQWKKGKIYDPEDGKTYGSKLRRLADGTLQVKGCIGPLCQTQIWTPSEQ